MAEENKVTKSEANNALQPSNPKTEASNNSSHTTASVPKLRLIVTPSLSRDKSTNIEGHSSSVGGGGKVDVPGGEPPKARTGAKLYRNPRNLPRGAVGLSCLANPTYLTRVFRAALIVPLDLADRSFLQRIIPTSTPPRCVENVPLLP